MNNEKLSPEKEMVEDLIAITAIFSARFHGLCPHRLLAGSPSPLAAFLAEARQCYNQLEQALVPIGEALQDLEQDWKSRPPAFWKRLEASLVQTQQVVNACIAAASTASIAHRSCLYYVIGRVDEVGTRMAAYREKSSSAQKQLRQRQLVLHALRELHEEGQETLAEGRAWLEQVQQDQYPASALTSKNAALPTSGDTPSHERRLAPTGSRANAERHLRLVRSEEPEVDM